MAKNRLVSILGGTKRNPYILAVEAVDTSKLSPFLFPVLCVSIIT
jgi:hypothetical protein